MRGKMSLSKALKHGGIQQANKSKNAFFFSNSQIKKYIPPTKRQMSSKGQINITHKYQEILFDISLYSLKDKTNFPQY